MPCFARPLMLAILLAACSNKLIVGNDPADASVRDRKTPDAADSHGHADGADGDGGSGDGGDGGRDGDGADGDGSDDGDTTEPPLDASTAPEADHAQDEEPTIGEDECNSERGLCLASSKGLNDPGGVGNPCPGAGLVLTDFTCAPSGDTTYACCMDECNSKGGECLYSGKGPTDPGAVNPCPSAGLTVTRFTCQRSDDALYACCMAP